MITTVGDGTRECQEVFEEHLEYRTVTLVNKIDSVSQKHWLQLRTVGDQPLWKPVLKVVPGDVGILPALPMSVAAAQEWVDRAGRSGEEIHGLLIPYRTQDERRRFDPLLSTLRPTWMLLIAVCAKASNARQQEQDLITALECGADESISEPLEVKLLIARLQSRFRYLSRDRRISQNDVAVTQQTEWLLAGGRLKLDLQSRNAVLDGQPLDLTPKEMDLLAFLASRADQCCTRNQILDSVWGIDFLTATNTVDVYVYFLRRKLKQQGLSDLVETVRSAGYRLKSNSSFVMETENGAQRKADDNE